PMDSMSLYNNFVWSLLQDNAARIWIGTFGGGLSMYNKYTRRFTTYYCAPPALESMEVNAVRSLTWYNDSTLVLGTEHGVLLFDISSRRFMTGGMWDVLRARDWFTYAVHVTADGHLLVATENGLFRVNPDRMTTELVDMPGDDTQTITDLCGVGDTLYIGSEFGLFATTDLTHFAEHLTENGQSPTRIGRIFHDRAGVLWLATEEGLAQYHHSIGYRWFKSDPTDPAALRTDLVHCIAEVEPGVLMAGTRQGVHLFSTEPPLFRVIGEDLACAQAILGMTEDHLGNIWVCSRQGMLHVRTSDNLNRWATTCYTTRNTPGMRNDYTINITQDDNHDLWLAYRNNGFSRIQVNDDVMTWHQYPKTVALFDGEGVNQIFQDAAGDYWIATRGFGLMQFFPEADSVQVYGKESGLSHPYIFRIYEDRRQRLWVGTANGGLCIFDRDTRQFTCYVTDRNDPYSISSNMVLAVSEDSRERLWVCTVDGLNVMESEPGKFTVMSTIDGLPNDVVYGALEDADSAIWVSTNEGIARMLFDGGIRSIDLFGTRDGLPGPEFNQHAFLAHSSGLLLFGSTDGLTVFDPKDMRASDYHPPVAITEFFLFGEPVPVAPQVKSTSFALDTSINDLNRIVLKHHQNSLAFKFAALGYAHSKIGSYAYMMEGLDDRWVTFDDSRHASYPRIAPGHYRFMVNVSNRNGVWNPVPKSIEVRILPPPWKTWWAYTLYALLIFGIIYTIVWFQSERARAIERAKATERDNFRNKMARDFHDESGNKITVLSLIVDQLRTQASVESAQRMLSELQHTIQDLRSGMRDFVWIMDPAQDTLFNTMVRFRDFASHLCEQAGIEFIEQGRAESLRDVTVEGNVRRHILLIFKEAINNSIKYAEANQITFSIQKSGASKWVIALRDDGGGFDPDRKSAGYGHNNMSARAQQIGGQISIQSEIGQGTAVILTWDNTSP
ncbi:MAG: two-component regulator propeller domain-containing protein, partial [Saprospiraceae bacterium]|nr:two-component regulator propeller domain-containing protein [Saprospiraceae bacterium]